MGISATNIRGQGGGEFFFGGEVLLGGRDNFRRGKTSWHDKGKRGFAWKGVYRGEAMEDLLLGGVRAPSNKTL